MKVGVRVEEDQALRVIAEVDGDVDTNMGGNKQCCR